MATQIGRPIDRNRNNTSLAEWRPPSLPYGLSDWLEQETASWPSGLTIRKAVAEALPAIIAQFRDGLEPHHPDAFERAMMELSVVFPNNRASDAELRARIVAYSAALEDIPSDLVLKAARLAIRKCEFFPKPAELRALVEDDMTDRRRKLHRAMMIARLPTSAESVAMMDRKSEVEGLVNRFAANRKPEDRGAL